MTLIFYDQNGDVNEPPYYHVVQVLVDPVDAKEICFSFWDKQKDKLTRKVFKLEKCHSKFRIEV